MVCRWHSRNIIKARQELLLLKSSRPIDIIQDESIRDIPSRDFSDVFLAHAIWFLDRRQKQRVLVDHGGINLCVQDGGQVGLALKCANHFFEFAEDNDLLP